MSPGPGCAFLQASVCFRGPAAFSCKKMNAFTHFYAPFLARKRFSLGTSSKTDETFGRFYRSGRDTARPRTAF